MKLKTPINENYAATLVVIKNIIKLDNCDNVVHTSIFGNLVVVDKETKIGDKGIFFPVETRLSDNYLYENNLYREPTANKIKSEKGYFEPNGRIRCVKFRGHRSEGLFMPNKSLLPFAEAVDVAALPEGSVFDEINGIRICEKYVPKITRTPGQPGSGNQIKKIKRASRLIDGQFRFHPDTAMLGKNIFKIKPSTLISITDKLHGTSFGVANILCKKKINPFLRFLSKVGIPIVNTEYAIIYNSRKVIKNDKQYNSPNHFYGEDLWKDIADQIKDILLPGMTAYGEAVGFTNSGKAIQHGYDYGYPKQGWSPGELTDLPGDTKNFGVYIYRLTLTTPTGQVVEFSAQQVQEWCKAHGLNPVPQFFYGRAGEFFPVQGNPSIEEWQGELLSKLLSSYNMEKLDPNCLMYKVPAEGLVLRIEDGISYDAYKLKSFAFRERETKLLDKGEIDLETEESV
jgi:hypothetical protein